MFQRRTGALLAELVATITGLAYGSLELEIGLPEPNWILVPSAVVEVLFIVSLFSADNLRFSAASVEDALDSGAVEGA